MIKSKPLTRMKTERLVFFRTVLGSNVCLNTLNFLAIISGINKLTTAGKKTVYLQVINPDGKLAAIFSSTNNPPAMARDFRALMHAYHQGSGAS